MDVPQENLLKAAKQALPFVDAALARRMLALAIEAVEQAHGKDPEIVTFRDAASAEYATDEVEIDDDAMISPSDSGGAWVQAWVWVSNEEAGIKDEDVEADDEIVVEE